MTSVHPHDPPTQEAAKNTEKDAAFAFVDKWTHEPCPTRGKRLCTITDPAHRHMAAHMVPPLSLSVRPGAERVDVLGMVEALDRVIPPG